MGQGQAIHPSRFFTLLLLRIIFFTICNIIQRDLNSKFPLQNYDGPLLLYGLGEHDTGS